MGAAGSREFPYDVGDAVAAYKPHSAVWTLHTGLSQADQSPVSIFRCSDSSKMALAKNAIKSMRRLRHPSVVKYLFSVESEEECCLVTEPVSSLFEVMEEMRASPAWLAWGLRQLAAALEFLHSTSAVHGAIGPSAVFVTAGGEWKLAGLELLGEAGREHPLMAAGGPAALLPKAYVPPEASGRGWQGPSPALDLYQLGCLCYELFNGPAAMPQRPLTGEDVTGIPRQLVAKYRALLATNPKGRGSAKQFGKCVYFQNDLASGCAFLAEIAIKDKEEKDAFFARLEPQLTTFPERVCKKKLLPELVAALDNGSANSRALGPILKIGTMLTDEEYQALAERVTAWFGAPDFNLRVNLLQNIGTFAAHLTPAMVSNGVFPKVLPGFAHESGALRELTVKAMVHLAPKLTPTLMTTQLLKCMAKLQLDPVPGIRTNTTICLAKVAEHVPASERSKTLIAAFVRAMHDPFPPARTAGVQSLAATQAHYNKEDIAIKIMPTLCKRAIDDEKDVRKHALSCIKSFVKKLEYISEHGEEQAAEQKGRVFGWVSSLTSFYSGSPSTKQPAASSSSTDASSSASEAEPAGRPVEEKSGARPASRWQEDIDEDDEFHDFDEEEEDDLDDGDDGVYGSSRYSRPAPSRGSSTSSAPRRAAKPMSLSAARAEKKRKAEEKIAPTKLDKAAWDWDNDDEDTASPAADEDEEFEEFESYEAPASASLAAGSFSSWGVDEDQTPSAATPVSASSFSSGWGDVDEEEKATPPAASSSLAFDDEDASGWGEMEDMADEDDAFEPIEETSSPVKASSSKKADAWGWNEDEDEAEETPTEGAGGWGEDFDDFEAPTPKETKATPKAAAKAAADGWGDDGGDFGAWDEGDGGDDGWGAGDDAGDDGWGFTASPSAPRGRAKRASGKDD